MADQLTYYVYIIQSEMDGSIYKGYTLNPEIRLAQHNAGESRYTSRKMPWKMVYLESQPDKTTALKREKSLKRANRQYIQWLIKQPTNLILE